MHYTNNIKIYPSVKVLRGFASIPLMKNEFTAFSGIHSRLIYYSKFSSKRRNRRVGCILAPWLHTHSVRRFFILPAEAKRFFRLNYCISIKVV